MVYDDRHRTFLQAIMQGGCVKEDEATLTCHKIFNERINLSTVIELINDKLSPIEMALKGGFCELTGDKYWCVVGTSHDEALMLQSEFSNAQRAFLRTIYAEIINSDDGCISSTDCLNLVSTLDMKFSMSEGDRFIKHMVRRKWLHFRDGSIYIGVRSIIELMPYFRATYVDNFHNCSLCKEVVFTGQGCAYCNHMYHSYCLAKYNSIQKGNKCPQCKNSWIATGEEDVPDEVSQRASQKGKSKKKDKRKGRIEEDDDEEEGEERNGGKGGTEEDEPMDVSDEMEISQPITVSRKAKRRKRDHK